MQRRGFLGAAAGALGLGAAKLLSPPAAEAAAPVVADPALDAAMLESLDKVTAPDGPGGVLAWSYTPPADWREQLDKNEQLTIPRNPELPLASDCPITEMTREQWWSLAEWAVALPWDLAQKAYALVGEPGGNYGLLCGMVHSMSDGRRQSLGAKDHDHRACGICDDALSRRLDSMTPAKWQVLEDQIRFFAKLLVAHESQPHAPCMTCEWFKLRAINLPISSMFHQELCKAFVKSKDSVSGWEWDGFMYGYGRKYHKSCGHQPYTYWAPEQRPGQPSNA